MTPPTRRTERPITSQPGVGRRDNDRRAGLPVGEPDHEQVPASDRETEAVSHEPDLDHLGLCLQPDTLADGLAVDDVVTTLDPDCLEEVVALALVELLHIAPDEDGTRSRRCHHRRSHDHRGRDNRRDDRRRDRRGHGRRRRRLLTLHSTELDGGDVLALPVDRGQVTVGELTALDR